MPEWQPLLSACYMVAWAVCNQQDDFRSTDSMHGASWRLCLIKTCFSETKGCGRGLLHAVLHGAGCAKRGTVLQLQVSTHASTKYQQLLVTDQR